MNTPPLRFPEFIGEWEKDKLSIIGEYIGGGTPDTSVQEYWEGNIPWISSSDIIENDIHNINIQKYITEEAIKNSATKKIPAYSLIIVSRVGVGKFAINKNIICTSQDFTNIVIDTKNFNADFSAYTLYKNIDILYNISQGTSIKGFTIVDLKKTELSFPTLPEQTKIATFLTAVDEKLQALKKKKSLLEQYKKGVMQKLFSRELRFKDENGKEFAEWEVKNGNLIFESVSNKNHNSDLPILAITQEYGAIPRDLIDYSVSVTDKSIESYKVVQVGDYIISLRSFQGGIEYSEYKGICSPAYIILRPTIPINNIFFKCYFKTENYIKELQKNLEGIRDGKMISYKYFSDIKLPYPSITEQTLIANFLTAIDNKINHTNTQIQNTEQWKKGLLQKMFV